MSGRDDEGELDRVLLRSVCHDLGSPLSSLTANVELATELLRRESAAATPSAHSLAELAEMLGDVSIALGSLTTLLADLREVAAAAPSDGPAPVRGSVEAALRLGRFSLAHARVVVGSSDLGDATLGIERPALVRALAHALIALARAAAPGSRLTIEPAPGRAGIALAMTPAVADHPALVRQIETVAAALARTGGVLSLEPAGGGATRLTLTTPHAEPSPG